MKLAFPQTYCLTRLLHLLRADPRFVGVRCAGEPSCPGREVWLGICEEPLSLHTRICRSS